MPAERSAARQRVLLAAALWGAAPAMASAGPPGGLGEIEIAGETVRFDVMRDRDFDGDGKPEQRAYYLGERMVAAAFDNDRDGNFDAWVNFAEDMHVTREVVDNDGDGRPDQVQAMDAKGRPQGAALALPDSASVEVHAVAAAATGAAAAAPTQTSESDEAEGPEYDPELLAWRIFPLDTRLFAALGLFAATLVPVGLSLRKRPRT